MLNHEFVKLCFGLALLVTVAIAIASRSNGSKGGAAGKAADERFRGFQRTYLVVYLMAMMADWLQGPYVYALYESYGFTQSDNAVLFTMGFGSSAVFGTVIGSLADRMGRRKFAALYCILYGVSCLTKHVNNFSFLMFGRVTGGIATSLLFSVFDSWMVSEHNRRNFDPELLGATFSLAVFGNSVVAITAGEVGQFFADMLELTPLRPGSDVYYGGYCMPFDVAIAFLIVALVAMSLMWSENYGNKTGSTSSGSLADTMSVAVRTIRQFPQVLYTGVVCSFFESSMFIFVFMWTPALTEEGQPKPPYGHIFATFMVMAMLGSQVFSLGVQSMSVEAVGRLTLMVSAVCHVVPMMTTDVSLRFMSFCIFELCVGVYFPMMGTLKGSVVPEESRSAIYSLYRVPLNVIVISVLAAHLELKTAFMLTTLLLSVAVGFQTLLIGIHGQSQYSRVGVDTEFGLDDDPGSAICGVDGHGEEELTTIMGSKT